MNRRLLVFLLLALAPAAASRGEATTRTVYCVVALADNVHQTIAPIPGALGDGQNPRTNLYWGALYGLRTTFDKSDDWERVERVKKPSAHVLERCVYRHSTEPVRLVAEAWDGARIREAIGAFLNAGAGRGPAADMVVYIGHDGLMDFAAPGLSDPPDGRSRAAVILACQSKRYFAEALERTGARPLVWTTGNMAPEAYTLKAVLAGWTRGEEPEAIRERAAQAYHRYQKCGIRAARRLFATGW